MSDSQLVKLRKALDGNLMLIEKILDDMRLKCLPHNNRIVSDCPECHKDAIIRYKDIATGTQAQWICDVNGCEKETGVFFQTFINAHTQKRFPKETIDETINYMLEIIDKKIENDNDH